MKSIKVLLSVLLMSTALFTFTSCGDDDDDPIRETVEKSHTYSIPVQGIANQPQANVKTELLLKDAVGESVADNLVSSEFQRSKSSLKIKGLKDIEGENVELRNFKIKVGSKEVDLGTCTAKSSEFESDIEYSSDKYTDVIKPIFDELVAKGKKSNVYISFTPSHTMTTKDSPVYLELTIGGSYLYNKK